ncbi:hypothetical protein PENTCL1PPCAC_4696, partial [Pristionchus entomophagus]
NVERACVEMKYIRHRSLILKEFLILAKNRTHFPLRCGEELVDVAEGRFHDGEYREGADGRQKGDEEDDDGDVVLRILKNPIELPLRSLFIETL